MAQFPQVRPRRLRQNKEIRNLIRETRIHLDRLVYPMFVIPGKDLTEEISAMPGVFRYSVDRLVEEVSYLVELGLKSLLLFGSAREKSWNGHEAWAEDSVVAEAVRALKENFPNIYLITDVCLCAYTDHGHCGLTAEDADALGKTGVSPKQAASAKGAEGYRLQGDTILNDETLDLLAKTAVAHARAGADMVAPSDMMDGRVAAIRQALDEQGFTHIPVMSYAIKYASAFYGPFREAADSAPSFGDRSSYQMDPANREEALREAALDIEEGADILMVKPALAYLDIIREVKNTYGYPLAAYNVSGEYAMVKAAAARGWIDERRVVEESITSMLRAGADIVITYFAKDLARYK
ncbi:MAG: porphobilinogen synthase [Peptococcaceae bacterium]|nr:porphobilinogen synthase [Peptococcaceae bacterium]